MLTEGERHRILIALRYFSSVSVLPIQVDVQGREIRSGFKSRRKAWASKLAYAIFVAHALYKSLSLIYVLQFLPATPLHQILIHGIIAAGNSIFVLWQYDLYWKERDVSMAFWNVSLNGNVSGGE